MLDPTQDFLVISAVSLLMLYIVLFQLSDDAAGVVPDYHALPAPYRVFLRRYDNPNERYRREVDEKWGIATNSRVVGLQLMWSVSSVYPFIANRSDSLAWSIPIWAESALAIWLGVRLWLIVQRLQRVHSEPRKRRLGRKGRRS